jgi:hypothetical protein
MIRLQRGHVLMHVRFSKRTADKCLPACWPAVTVVACFYCARQLDPERLSVQVELPLPLLAANLMFEYAEFHDVANGECVSGRERGAAGMLCPRCGRPVTDMHGICRQCGEVRALPLRNARHYCQTDNHCRRRIQLGHV